MVPIPAGDFVMGSPDDEFGRDPDEKAHPISITQPFYLGATPVTVVEFRIFVRDTKYETTAEATIGRGWNAETEQWEYSPYNWRTAGLGAGRRRAGGVREFCRRGGVLRMAGAARTAGLTGCRPRRGVGVLLAGPAHGRRSASATNCCAPSQANFDHRFLYDIGEVGLAGPGRTTLVGATRRMRSRGCLTNAW